MDKQRPAEGAESANGDASSQSEGALQKPDTLDFKKANKAVKKIVRENQEWLKEMANR